MFWQLQWVNQPLALITCTVTMCTYLIIGQWCSLSQGKRISWWLVHLDEKLANHWHSKHTYIKFGRSAYTQSVTGSTRPHRSHGDKGGGRKCDNKDGDKRKMHGCFEDQPNWNMCRRHVFNSAQTRMDWLLDWVWWRKADWPSYQCSSICKLPPVLEP